LEIRKEIFPKRISSQWDKKSAWMVMNSCLNNLLFYTSRRREGLSRAGSVLLARRTTSPSTPALPN
jgi:hypothetical protein